MIKTSTALVIGAALALTACGGGSDNTPSSTPAPAPVPSPAPAPASASAPEFRIDRIESFDPGVAPAAAAASKRAVISIIPARTVALGSLSRAVTKSSETDKGRHGMPLQIGQSRSVTETLTASATAALLQWQTDGDGTQVAALRFVAEGAQGLRLGVLVRALPAGAVLRVHGPQNQAADSAQITAQALQAMVQRNVQGGSHADEARTWWSPDTGGAEATLEIRLPAGTHPASVDLSVPRLSHFTQSFADAMSGAGAAKTAKAGASSSGSCKDATCRPEYLEQARSVAQMNFVTDGTTYMCTGTLINDEQSSGTPYLLSANHCINRQEVASTLETRWFYRSSACDSGQLGLNQVRLTGGSELLLADAATDVGLLRLNEPPPAGAVYAGTFFGEPLAVDTTLVALHHSNGDMLKFSQARLDGYQVCKDGDISTCADTTVDKANYWRLRWQQGGVEGGGSGSAAFAELDGKRYVVGQLFGGNSSCTTPGGMDIYGRLDRSMRYGLSKWLLSN